MKEIQLTKNKIALVDDSDYEFINSFKWCYLPNRTGYAVRQVGTNQKSKHQSMHRLILGNPNMLVDHSNGNTLDNRRSNLRVATHQQNQFNQKIRSDNTTGYKGVSYIPRLRKYKAQINIDKKPTHLGLFINAIDAAKAYDEIAVKTQGEFARLNFPR